MGMARISRQVPITENAPADALGIARGWQVNKRLGTKTPELAAEAKPGKKSRKRNRSGAKPEKEDNAFPMYGTLNETPLSSTLRSAFAFLLFPGSMHRTGSAVLK
jgi:hypothetical protein